jgi:hypothetical protein
MTLLYIAVIIVACFYGLNIDNDKTNNTTKVCVAITCNMESSDTEGTSAVRIKQPPSLGP